MTDADGKHYKLLYTCMAILARYCEQDCAYNICYYVYIVYNIIRTVDPLIALVLNHHGTRPHGWITLYYISTIRFSLNHSYR